MNRSKPTDYESVELGDRVRLAIEAIDANTADIAKNLGCSTNTISTYRKRRRSKDVKGSALEGLAKHYNVSPEYLLLGTGPIFTSDKLAVDPRSIDTDIESERTRLHLVAKKAELEYLRRIKPDDDPEASMKQLEFIGQMVERFRSFQKSLFDKETTH